MESGSPVSGTHNRSALSVKYDGVSKTWAIGTGGLEKDANRGNDGRC